VLAGKDRPPKASAGRHKVYNREAHDGRPDGRPFVVGSVVARIAQSDLAHFKNVATCVATGKKFHGDSGWIDTENTRDNALWTPLLQLRNRRLHVRILSGVLCFRGFQPVDLSRLRLCTQLCTHQIRLSRPGSGCKQFVNFRDCRRRRIRQEVCVHVPRDTRLGMSQSLRDSVYVHAGSDRQTGRCVTQTAGHACIAIRLVTTVYFTDSKQNGMRNRNNFRG